MERDEAFRQVSYAIWGEINESVVQEELVNLGMLDTIYLWVMDYDIDVTLDFIKRISKIRECNCKVIVACEKPIYESVKKYIEPVHLQVEHIEPQLLDGAQNNIVLFNTHVHSLDSWEIENFLKENNVYVFSRFSKDLYRIKDVKLHTQSIQMYWNLVNWFNSSKIGETYFG